MSMKFLIEILGVAGLTTLSLSGPVVAHDFNHFNGWQNGWGPGQMMGQGYMTGQGHMMGPGFNGQGNFGPGMMQPLRDDLDIVDVMEMMEHRLRWMNNPNLKLGNVEEKDADTISADIVTKDGSLVQRLSVDRHTGWMQPSQ